MQTVSISVASYSGNTSAYFNPCCCRHETTRLVSQLSLCVSRACLGNRCSGLFSIKRRKQDAFPHPGASRAAAAASSSVPSAVRGAEGEQPAERKRLLFQRFVVLLSRACLGKLIGFSKQETWLNKQRGAFWFVHTHRRRSEAARVSPSSFTSSSSYSSCSETGRQTHPHVMLEQKTHHHCRAHTEADRFNRMKRRLHHAF